MKHHYSSKESSSTRWMPSPAHLPPPPPRKLTLPHSLHSNSLVWYTAPFFRTDLNGLEDLPAGVHFDAWTDVPDWADPGDCTVTLDCPDIEDRSDERAEVANWEDLVIINDLAHWLDWSLRATSVSESCKWIRIGLRWFNWFLRTAKNKKDVKKKI
jgi:hypothetical protein